jgi:hypothetical protein
MRIWKRSSLRSIRSPARTFVPAYWEHPYRVSPRRVPRTARLTEDLPRLLRSQLLRIGFNLLQVRELPENHPDSNPKLFPLASKPDFSTWRCARVCLGNGVFFRYEWERQTSVTALGQCRRNSFRQRGVRESPTQNCM